VKKRLWLPLLLAACSSSEPEVTMLAGPASTATESTDAALAIDPGTGDVVMSWVEGDTSGYALKVARSTDGGATWSEPSAVTTSTGEVKPHAEAAPRLVAASGALGVFWSRQHHVPGRRFPASEMRFARSLDGGRAWSAPITLNDDTTGAPAGHTFHGATAVGDSTFVVAWLDSRQVVDSTHGAHLAHHEGSSYVFSTSSNDLGAHWQPANRKFWGNACPCCRVSLAPAADGVIAAWRGHFEGDVRDIVVAKLAEGERPERVHADNWVFPGCPHSGPGLAADGEDLHLAWFTGAPERMGVYYTRRGGEPVQIVGGQALPTGHPAVAPLADGAVVAVNLNSAGERVLSVAFVHAGSARVVEVPDTQGADHPQIVRIANDQALIAWTQNARLRVARVTID
jgi:hypothetical protein